jgi:hypothetical protein
MERKLEEMSDQELRTLFESMQVGDRIKVRYRPESWDYGGGSLNLAANAIVGLFQVARGVATGHTEVATGEFDGFSPLGLRISNTSYSFAGTKRESVTHIPLGALVSINILTHTEQPRPADTPGVASLSPPRPDQAISPIDAQARDAALMEAAAAAIARERDGLFDRWEPLADDFVQDLHRHVVLDREGWQWMNGANALKNADRDLLPSVLSARDPDDPGCVVTGCGSRKVRRASVCRLHLAQRLRRDGRDFPGDDSEAGQLSAVVTYLTDLMIEGLPPFVRNGQGLQAYVQELTGRPPVGNTEDPATTTLQLSVYLDNDPASCLTAHMALDVLGTCLADEFGSMMLEEPVSTPHGSTRLRLQIAVPGGALPYLHLSLVQLLGDVMEEITGLTADGDLVTLVTKPQ